MLQRNQKGVNLITVLVWVVVLGLLIGGAFLLVNSERAKTRDAKRLSDISRIQAAFEFLYNDTASYELAAQNGCNKAGMLVSQCNLGQYVPTIAQFTDPGSGTYQVTKVPNAEGYEVTFILERTYASLRAGKHTLSQVGIR